MASEQPRDADARIGLELRAIVSDELRIAREGDRAYLRRVLLASATVGIAVFLLYLGVVFLALMMVYILGALIEPWIGAAIVGSGIVVVAGIATVWAWRRAQTILQRNGPQ